MDGPPVHVWEARAGDSGLEWGPERHEGRPGVSPGGLERLLIEASCLPAESVAEANQGYRTKDRLINRVVCIGIRVVLSRIHVVPIWAIGGVMAG